MKKSKIAITLGLVVGIVLSAFAFLFGYTRYLLSLPTYDTEGTIPIETNLDQLPDLEPEMKEGMKIPVYANPQNHNILLIGSDRRDDKSYGRSDSMILLSINEKTDKFHLTSFQRTIWVSIPEDTDPRYKRYWSPNYTLNAAHTWGGPRLLLKTIQRNFRLDVQNYVKVDFKNFVKVVDRVGGVEIELSKAEASNLKQQGIQVTAGKQLLNGDACLAYSRIRKIDSDWKRMGRQRTVIEALIKKLRSMSPLSLPRVLEDIMRNIETNLTPGQLQGYMLNVLKYRKYEIDQMFVPIEQHKAIARAKNGQEVYKLNWVKNIEAIRAFIDQ
ncbi:MAG: LCP family protein [Saccharofermentanales bacterium]|jgi:LCP family protein required for cell wall assembly